MRKLYIYLLVVVMFAGCKTKEQVSESTVAHVVVSVQHTDTSTVEQSWRLEAVHLDTLSVHETDSCVVEIVRDIIVQDSTDRVLLKLTEHVYGRQQTHSHKERRQQHIQDFNEQSTECNVETSQRDSIYEAESKSQVVKQQGRSNRARWLMLLLALLFGVGLLINKIRK